MGQGYFTMYAYGVSFKPSKKIYEIVYDDNMDFYPFMDGIKTSLDEDLDRFYVCIPLADCGQGYLNDEPVVSMTSYGLSETKDILLQALKKENQESIFVNAKAKWQTLQEEFKNRGYELPDGEIIIVHDYD